MAPIKKIVHHIWRAHNVELYLFFDWLLSQKTPVLWVDLLFFFLVFNRGHCEVLTSAQCWSYVNPLYQVTAVTAESFMVTSPICFPYTITWLLLKSQHVMRDSALELGPPSSTGKLIPLLHDACPSRCTRLPSPTDGIFPHLIHGHTSFTARMVPMK